MKDSHSSGAEPPARDTGTTPDVRYSLLYSDSERLYNDPKFAATDTGFWTDAEMSRFAQQNAKIAQETLDAANMSYDTAKMTPSPSSLRTIIKLGRAVLALRARLTTEKAQSREARKSIVEKWALKLAVLAEPDHDADWGIYADWLNAFLADISRAT